MILRVAHEDVLSWGEFRPQGLRLFRDGREDLDNFEAFVHNVNGDVVGGKGQLRGCRKNPPERLAFSRGVSDNGATDKR